MGTENVNSLFTITSLISIQGATLAVTLIISAIGFLVGKKFTEGWRKWSAFVFSFILAFLTAIIATETGYLKWIVAFFNGFVIFAASMGLNQAATKAGENNAAVLGEEKRKFFSTWL